jgi:hypothetical protein
VRPLSLLPLAVCIALSACAQAQKAETASNFTAAIDAGLNTPEKTFCIASGGRPPFRYAALQYEDNVVPNLPKGTYTVSKDQGTRLAAFAQAGLVNRAPGKVMSAQPIMVGNPSAPAPTYALTLTSIGQRAGQTLRYKPPIPTPPSDQAQKLLQIGSMFMDQQDPLFYYCGGHYAVEKIKAWRDITESLPIIQKATMPFGTRIVRVHYRAQPVDLPSWMQALRRTPIASDLPQTQDTEERLYFYPDGKIVPRWE